jgi:hypothetical protein
MQEQSVLWTVGLNFAVASWRFSTVFEARLEEWHKNLFWVTSVTEPDVEFLEEIATISWVRRKAINSADHSVNESCEDSGRMCQVWRQVKVEIEWLFEQFCSDRVVGVKSNGDIQVVNLSR